MGDNLDLAKILGYPLHGRCADGSFRPFMIDKQSRSMVMIGAHDHCNHNGKSYLTSASTLVNTGGKLGFRLKAGSEIDNNMHIKLEFSASLHAILRTWFPSISGHAAGTETNILNRNLALSASDSYASGASICYAPTTADTDTPARKIYMGSAGRGANLGTGGYIEQAELIIEPGTPAIYLELESLADGNSLSFFAWWSEGQDYD